MQFFFILKSPKNMYLVLEFLPTRIEIEVYLKPVKFNYLALMSFDGPDQILPIFHHLMTLVDPKTSCLLMDPNQGFPLSKSHVF